MKGWTTYGVELPASVTKIVDAAGGADPKRGGMPFAMASILGALPWIAVALFKVAPKAEYLEFAAQVKANMQQAWEIIGSDNPPKAFDDACDAAKKAIN